MTNIIEVNELTKLYKTGNVLAVDHINCAIPDRSITSIIGKSGCGKTTLLNLIGGLDVPTSGKVCVMGSDISHMTESKLSNFRSQNIGFVFQFFNLIPELTARENILFSLALQKKKVDREKLDLISHTLEIHKIMQRLPSQLSGGQQQRVAIARAIINSPKLLLMDEPTGNLDEENSTIIRNLLLKLRDDFGITILYVTHDWEMANIADRVIKLRDGKIDSIQEKI